MVKLVLLFLSFVVAAYCSCEGWLTSAGSYSVEKIDRSTRKTFGTHDRPVTKFLLHTIEGNDWPGYGDYEDGTSVLDSVSAWPHFIVAGARASQKVEIGQYIPLNYRGRALRNPGNHGGVIQVEIGGVADTPFTANDAELTAAVRALYSALQTHCPTLPNQIDPRITFRDSPESYGYKSLTRLSITDYHGVHGLIGHQHAPRNSHWDPGEVDPTTVLCVGTSCNAGKTFKNPAPVADACAERLNGLWCDGGNLLHCAQGFTELVDECVGGQCDTSGGNGAHQCTNGVSQTGTTSLVTATAFCAEYRDGVRCLTNNRMISCENGNVMGVASGGCDDSCLHEDVITDSEEGIAARYTCELGVLTNCGQVNFCPMQIMSRGDAAVAFDRALVHADASYASSKPAVSTAAADRSGLSTSVGNAMDALARAGVLTSCNDFAVGVSGWKLCAHLALTRAELAVWLMNAVAVFSLSGDVPSVTAQEWALGDVGAQHRWANQIASVMSAELMDECDGRETIVEEQVSSRNPCSFNGRTGTCRRPADCNLFGASFTAADGADTSQCVSSTAYATSGEEQCCIEPVRDNCDSVKAKGSGQQVHHGACCVTPEDSSAWPMRGSCETTSLCTSSRGMSVPSASGATGCNDLSGSISCCVRADLTKSDPCKDNGATSSTQFIGSPCCHAQQRGTCSSTCPANRPFSATNTFTSGCNKLDVGINCCVLPYFCPWDAVRRIVLARALTKLHKLARLTPNTYTDTDASLNTAYCGSSAKTIVCATDSVLGHCDGSVFKSVEYCSGGCVRKQGGPGTEDECGSFCANKPDGSYCESGSVRTDCATESAVNQEACMYGCVDTEPANAQCATEAASTTKPPMVLTSSAPQISGGGDPGGDTTPTNNVSTGPNGGVDTSAAAQEGPAALLEGPALIAVIVAGAACCGILLVLASVILYCVLRQPRSAPVYLAEQRAVPMHTTSGGGRSRGGSRARSHSSGGRSRGHSMNYLRAPRSRGNSYRQFTGNDVL